MLAGAAILVGLLSGAGVWIFKRLIDLSHLVAFNLFEGSIAHIGSWTVLIVPVLGGLLVGLLWQRFVGEERHHGVAGIMEAVALAGGRLQYALMPIKTLISAISIGVGASVGPEDPSVQVGANIGSMTGQIARLSDDHMRALVAAGAAGGIAAAFNAPIAGVFFAIEVTLGELSAGSLGAVTLAAVISAVFTQAVSGPQPAFPVSGYVFRGPQELPLYLVLGLVAGPVAAAYIHLLDSIHGWFHHWGAPTWVKPAAAGLLVGLVGIFLPQLFGVGYDTIGAVLNGGVFTLGLVLLLLVGKLILTPISIGGGFPGGVFAPSLFIGAMTGEAYGLILNLAFPSLHVVPPAFAMVGMAAVLAGAVHSPLTAIILLFEMTNDYRIILPVMFGVVVCQLVAQRLEPDSVYTKMLARKGIRLERGRDVEVLQGITVGEVMETNIESLHDTDLITHAAEIMTNQHHHGLMVLNAEDQLVGVITLQDLEREQNMEKDKHLMVGEVCTRELLVTYPDETIGAALRRMGTRDIGRLPVVLHEDPLHLVGVLRRSAIARAYDLALTRRAEMRHRAHQVRLGDFSGASVVEVVVEPGAPVAEKPVSVIPWPRDSVLATVRHRRQVVFPRGDTVIHSGDVLVVVADASARDDLQALAHASKANPEPETVKS